MDLRRIDLNLLVAFDVLLKERSVTRAAEQLSITQSAMSATLNRLRKLFDDPILIKEGRGVVPSPLAESLVEPVDDLLTRSERVLTRARTFDPATVQAPGIRLHLFPTADDFADQLRRHRVDLLIIPREAFDEHAQFPHQVLFHDRYLVAVDKDHPDVGDHLSLEQFSTLPYLAASSGRLRSLAAIQLDFLGVPRNVEVTTPFGLAPFLLKGTRLITLIQERYARQVADSAGIRLLAPPVPQLQPITQIMAWTKRTDEDPGHRWLRQQLTDLAAELDT